MRKMKVFLGFCTFFVLAFAVGVSAQAVFQGGFGSSSFVNNQLTAPSFQTYYGPENRLATYWPILDDSASCEAREDFILQIAPGGCQPGVVRSDLLAEQNVPVFCQIDALQINPLIDVKEIRNIRFTGQYPTEIAGIGFHPANAALRTNDILLGSPVINNIGYAVVVLRQQKNESAVPNSVKATLSAQLEYYAGNAYGIGATQFVLEPQTEQQWREHRSEQSFFRGEYSVRVDDADTRFALVSLYKGDVRVASTRVERGKLSEPIYLPGFYCRAGVQISYDGFVAEQDKARIQISDERGTDAFDIYQGSYFLDNACYVRSVNIEKNGKTGNVEFVCQGKRYSLFLRQQEGGNALSLADAPLNNGTFEREVGSYLQQTISSYENLAKTFPAERVDVGQQTFGEAGLLRAIDLAREFKQAKTELRLRNLLLELYPTAQSAFIQQQEITKLSQFDYSGAVQVANVGSRPRTISLVSLTKANRESSNAKATILLDDSPVTLKIGEEVPAFNNGYIKLKYIDVNRVSFEYLCKGPVNEKNPRTGVRPGLVLLEQTISLCPESTRVRLLEVNDIDRVAMIRLVPQARAPTTETNLTVQIGIEKNNIQLSPEKAKQRIENLEENIASWEKINNNLGNVVSGLKGACFATAGVLTVKNFISGVGGEALARDHVMSGAGGWIEKCGQMKGTGTYSTLDECLSKNKETINSAIQKRTDALQKVNSALGTAQEGLVQKGLIESSVSDVDELKRRYAVSLSTQYPDLGIPADSEGLKFYTIADLRELHYNRLLLGQNDVNQEKVTKTYNEISNKINASREMAELIKQSEKNAGQVNVLDDAAAVGDLQNLRIARTPVFSLEGATLKNAGRGSKNLDVGQEKLPENSKAAGFMQGSRITNPQTGERTNPESFMVVGSLTKAGVVEPKAIYSVTQTPDKVIVGKRIANTSAEISSFYSNYKIQEVRDLELRRFENPISAVNQEVRYFGYGPLDGKPSLVPFDIQKGWYVNVRPVSGLGGEYSNFDKSGAPRVFDICNVGANSIIDSDDDCQTIHVGVNDNHPVMGLSESESRTVVARAKQALIDASSQKGNSIVRIGSNRLPVGQATAVIDGKQCYQFMSISDCNILFNVCDPVICPASRCNFGGKYQVDDVIQTGIVGSALLCLPNFGNPAEGGVAVPVCLTGIHAGIDAYVSVMQQHRDCLKENLETGQLVGICDQIYSLRLCDLFWRQFTPVANVLLPKIIESAYQGKVGGVPRNGGEYLTVMRAWQNTQQSVNFFTQHYAVKSLEAFQARSLEEVGTEVCKGFISMKAPTSLKTLLEPDSPPQFFAQFDSKKFTDATVPPTAQYKVFYHIFAGKDRGVQYSVFLQDPPDSPYYRATPRIFVATGFIGRGESTSEAKDFTAPEGYKELCVMINDKTECGFKQVTTDFALNYLRDSYAQNQLEQTDIKSESECIYGTPDARALLANTNLQSAGEEAALPKVYQRGIVRICSSVNPGTSTNPNRYTSVGKCDEQRTCWLDMQSIDNALTDSNIGVRNETLQTLKNVQLKGLELPQPISSETGADVRRFNELKDSFEQRKENLAVKYPSGSVFDMSRLRADVDALVKEIDTKRETILVFNHHKAIFLRIKAEVYEKALRLVQPGNIKEKDKSNPVEPDSVTTPQNNPTPTTGEANEAIADGNSVGETRQSASLDKPFRISEQRSMNILVDGKESGVYLTTQTQDNTIAVMYQSGLGVGAQFISIGKVEFSNVQKKGSLVLDISASNTIGSQLYNLLQGAEVVQDSEVLTTKSIDFSSNSIAQEKIMKFANTLDNPCSSDYDCAGSCTSNSERTHQVCIIGKCVSSIDSQTGLCSKWDASCRVFQKQIPNGRELFGDMYEAIEYSGCISSKTTCDKPIFLYDPAGGGASITPDTSKGLYAQLSISSQIGSVYSVFSGDDLINTLKSIKNSCSSGISTLILSAHGTSGIVHLYDENITTEWCVEHKNELASLNLFASGGKLILNACSVAEDIVGGTLPRCLADSLGVTVYASKCDIGVSAVSEGKAVCDLASGTCGDLLVFSPQKNSQTNSESGEANEAILN